MSNRIKTVYILLTGLLVLGGIYYFIPLSKKGKIKIQWTDNPKGDFGFSAEWDYPEGVYRNEFGQLDCNGLCPEGIERLKDATGKIRTDSMDRFYQLVDTTHLYHSILCEVRCDEWAGTNFISARRLNENTVYCATAMNAATHCSLVFEISGDICTPGIELLSISPSGQHTYYCKSGFIKVSRDFWKKGILRAEFHYVFDNTDKNGEELFWKGKIHTPIEE